MWLKEMLDSSIGKKVLMAFTGLFFCFFLTLHLIGNLTLYVGKEVFNSYAANLHSLGPVITFVEVLMLFFAVIHIATGIMLFIQNRSARPVGYVVNRSGGGSTTGSSSMPYTGFVILVFVIIHLINFHFEDHGELSVYDIVNNTFGNPSVMVFYVVAVLAVSVHLSHGFWSAFQSIGLNSQKYTPGLRVAGIFFSIFIGAGFGLIPLWLAFFV